MVVSAIPMALYYFGANTTHGDGPKGENTAPTLDVKFDTAQIRE